MAKIQFVLMCAFLAYSDGRYFRNDYKYVSSVDGWLKLHQIPSSWEEARLRCFFEGGVLASPLDEKLLAAMKTEMGKSIPTVFTGISAIYSNSNFFSVEGVSLESIARTWAPGEPNHSGQESCVAIGMNANGSLLDVSCNYWLPYFCYKKNSHDIPSVDHCGTVDPDYTFDARTGHCYKFHRFGQAWSRAFMACASEGAYLTIINSDVEAQVLRELMAKNPTAKIVAKHKDFIGAGFHDWSQHGVFMTVHGQTLKEAGYENWSGGQPDNATTGEYCGSIFRDAKLNDIWCQDSIPFICEKEPGSLLDNGSANTDEVTNIDLRQANQ